MLEFIKLIDVDYGNAFTCPVCSQLPHNELVVIIDGKEMGMNRALAKPYVAPLSSNAETVSIEWYASTDSVDKKIYVATIERLMSPLPTLPLLGALYAILS